MLVHVSLGERGEVTGYRARVNLDRQEVEGRLAEALEAAGLKVYRSFSLHEALETLPDRNCQCHGTDKCTCIYSVLLAYDEASLPALIVAHGRDGWLEVQVTGSSLGSRARGRILRALGQALGVLELEPV